jgi:hypothetical protein
MTLRHPEWQEGQTAKAAIAAAYLRSECGRTSKPQFPNQALVDSQSPGP